MYDIARMFEPPTSKEGLPRVTLAMLVDVFPTLKTNEAALEAKRVFRWFAPWSDDTKVARDDLQTASTLFVCQPQQAQALLGSAPSTFALVACGTAAEGTQVEVDLAAYDGRFAFATERDVLEACLELNAYFTKMLAWERELERISLRRGSLVDMLKIGARMMGNFMFINDSDFNVIAHTDTIEPPDEFHRSMIQNRCLDIDSLVEERFRLPEGRFYSRRPQRGIMHTRLSAPVHFSHMYCGSISMSCHEREDTQGMRDLFTTFLRYALPICNSIWSKQAEMRMPSAVFLVRLLEEQHLEDSYIESQMELLGLTGMSQFKLIAMEQDDDLGPAKRAAVLQSAATLNAGKVYCFPFRNHILALGYSPANRSAISRKHVHEELREKIWEPYGLMASASCTFYDLSDIGAAYRQACIALEFRATIQRERSAMDEPVSSVAFEDALAYYLLDRPEKDGRLVDIVFERSIPSLLYEEDQQEQTSVAEILWHYLTCKGSATVVSRRLRIHRNTVLYHIEKLQKRFDIDLDDPTTCEWLTLGFKHLFLSLGSESAERAMNSTKAGPYQITYEQTPGL